MSEDKNDLSWRIQRTGGPLDDLKWINGRFCETVDDLKSMLGIVETQNQRNSAWPLIFIFDKVSETLVEEKTLINKAQAKW